MTTDKVYAHPRESIEAFQFDAGVADVFENMINRSVPGYALILDLIGLVTEKYAVPDTNCYDLGCSLGAATLMMRRHLPPSCRVIGVDNSPAMIERCRANVARDHSGAAIEIIEQDLRTISITNASVVVMNFTLQFVPAFERAELLARIASGLVPGGVLLLAEKVRFENTDVQTFMTDLHHEFKRQQGYSDLEIAQKRAALENVLVPDTETQHTERLLSAGFNEVYSLTRCMNFSAFLAIR